MKNSEIYRTEFDMVVLKHCLTYKGYIIRVNDDAIPRLFELTNPSGNVLAQGQFLHDFMDDVEAIAPFKMWELA